jgi:hypothetical protein
MTVTVEIMKHGTLNLLRALEKLGLIHVQPSVPQDAGEIVHEEEPPYQWLRGCCKDKPEGSVDNFLARCREDKEYELAIERRQEEERARRRADAKLSSCS